MAERDGPPDTRLLALQEALAGRYSLQRELGRGGMGVVYLAQEVRLERPVALKVLPPELSDQPAFRERFLREARTAARLSHPHIVPVYAADEADDFVFFAMAYIEGETLGERIRQRGPLSTTEAKRVLKEAAWALGYAHAQGVVHRDVKPDNILLEAGTGRALVTDFGIAYATRTDSGLTATADAEILGTAEFMSPEQASGKAPEGRSDIYSLGVVGHYALSGRFPFQGETVAATLAQHLTQPPAALRSVAPEVPAALGSALDRCLAKDPSDRFEDGEKLAAALGDALERRTPVPAALRLFLEEAHAQPMGMALFTGYGLVAAGTTVSMALTSDIPAWAVAILGAFSAAITATPVGILIRKARRLLRSGYEYDELLRALRDEVEERRRGIHLAGAGREPTRLDRWLKRLTAGGLVAWTGGFLWLGWGPYIGSSLFWTLFGSSMVALPVISIGSALAWTVRGNPGKKVRGHRWLRFWESRIGRGIFAAAGLRLDDRTAVGPGYRPTAVAIGMAADRLFRELPPTLRREFAPLPSVVKALEEDAERIRTQIQKLDAALVDVGAGGHGPGAAPAEIRRARESAESRLGQVVAALESLRLQLIKVTAGIGSVDQLTEHLGAAEALAADVERVVEAGRALDDLLGIRAPTEQEPTPTPTGGG